MDLLRHDHGLTGTGQRFPRGETLLDIYSRSVNTGQPARDVIAAEFPWCEPHTDAILDLFRAYVARKRRSRCWTSTTCCWAGGPAGRPRVGPAHGGRWDHVLVDEYQDVNQIQVDIVRLLRPDGPG